MLSVFVVLKAGKKDNVLLTECPAAAAAQQLYPIYSHSDDSISNNPSANTFNSSSSRNNVLGDFAIQSNRKGGDASYHPSQLYPMYGSGYGSEVDSLSNYSSTYSYPRPSATRNDASYH